MLPRIQTILYTTDLSDNSRLAFDYAASLAERYDADLMVLHVVEPVHPNTHVLLSSSMGESEWVHLQSDYEEGLSDDLGAKMGRFAASLGLTVESAHIRDEGLMIRKGMPAEEIIAAAGEYKADIIVMGTHGYGMVKDALMGGTARRVVRRSGIPVLVVRSPEQDQ